MNFELRRKLPTNFTRQLKSYLKCQKDEISDLKRLQNYIRALRGKAEELEAEKTDYELIKSGKVEVKVSSLSNLGISLVNARIKSGMDRVTLAKHLKVSEGQIVSNETKQYSITAIDEIRKTAKIFNVEIPEKVIPSHFNGKISVLLSKLKKAGFNRKFVLSRLIYPLSLDKVAKQSGASLDKYTLGLYKHLKHVFGWNWEQLTGTADLPSPVANSASAKFKVESSPNPEKN